MSRDDIRKLLGGYATDTLTEAERRALFAAALEDQELFDALAKEQALRDVLREPAARRQLIEALGPEREPFSVRVWRWLRQPAGLSLAGGLAALLIVGGIVLRQPKPAMRSEVMVAEAPAPPPPAGSPAPAKVLERPAAVRKAKPSVALPAAIAEPAAHEVAANTPATPPAPAADLLRPLEMSKKQVLAVNERDALESVQVNAAAPAFAPQVEYSLLLKGADGSYAPVPADTIFHAGDSVRLKVEPNSAGFLHLLQRTALGWSGVASQPVEPAQTYILPSPGELESDTPAHLELLLYLSNQQEPSLARVPAVAAVGKSKLRKGTMLSPKPAANGLVGGAISAPPAAVKIAIEFR